MNIGKTLFAQLMDFLPWSTFARIVARYGGDARVRTLCCAEQYRAMAFAQLTYRESLRDIEVCLSARASKLYHIGFREPVRRSTLNEANWAHSCFIPNALFMPGLIENFAYWAIGRVQWVRRTRFPELKDLTMAEILESRFGQLRPG